VSEIARIIVLLICLVAHLLGYAGPERPTVTRPSAADPGTARRITPSPTPTGTRPATTTRPRTASPPRHSLRGVATWFRSPAGVSAAGPNLRATLGPGWRGMTVRVCAGDRCALTVLGDWCACGPRPDGPTLIDLDDNVFARLAPLGRGVLREVTITW